MKKNIHQFCLLFLVVGMLTFADETFGVPIPVVGTSPNSGSILGVLLAVISETDGHIDSIMAPVVMYNALVGYEADFNYFGFPSENITYQLYFSHTSENFWEYTIDYQQKQFLRENLTFNALARFSRDANWRFFGIGPETTEDDETSYTSRNIYTKVSLTLEFIEHFFVAVSLEGRRKWIREGVVEDVDSIEERFADVPGVVDGGYALPLRISLMYDTRNNQVTPTEGLYFRGFAETAHKDVLSSFSYQRYGFEGRLYIPLDPDSRFVLVVRGLAEYMEGKKVPFFELSSLGGAESLRGFPDGRFYDNHRVVLNIEQRIRLMRFFVGDILLDIEGAVFAEFGQVFPSISDLKFKNIQEVLGVAIRFVVRNQIVAKVDIGYGQEGMAVYAGLNYPF